MEANIELNDLRAKFVGSFTGYAHFCSAQQLHDFRLTFYKKDVRFGVTELSLDQVPEWFQQHALVNVAKKLHDELGSRKYALASVHYGTRSAGTYSAHSIINNWLFDNLKANSMDITNSVDESGNGEHLVEVLLTKPSLEKWMNVKVGIPKEYRVKPKKATTGITEEDLMAYLTRS